MAFYCPGCEPARARRRGHGHAVAWCHEHAPAAGTRTAGWVVYRDGRAAGAGDTRVEAVEAARLNGCARGVARPVGVAELNAAAETIAAERLPI